jgi:hypothetical protein
MKKIKFLSERADIDFLKPEPSVKHVPDWFKGIPTVRKNILTIKRCVPVLDAFTIGYMMRTSADVFYDSESKRFIDNGITNVITHHEDFQIDGWEYDDSFEPHPYKWSNNFFIQTPKGYGSLFVHPLNRDDLPFRSLSGFVDTDEFPLSVQFPFLIKKGFHGLIPAGTPIAQVIPVKRDDWSADFGNENESYTYKEMWKWYEPPLGKYKRSFWKKKKYQ